MQRIPPELEGCVLQHLSRSEMGKVARCSRRSARPVTALASMLRALGAARLSPALRALRGAWTDAQEARVLRRIHERLLRVGAVTPPLVELMDPSASLKAFNESIGWLDDYHRDEEFVDLLLRNGGATWWEADERAFVDHWRREFVEHWHFGWQAGPSDRVGRRPGPWVEPLRGAGW